MTTDCDVLVLGAGPAGASLAVHLARAGLSVVLADKKAFPRPKPCGEFLSPECRPYLRELGIDDSLLRAGTRLVTGMELHRGRRCAPGHFVALGGSGHGGAGYAVRREVLDLQILEAARARPEVRWLERHDFRALLRAADGRIQGAVLAAPDRSAVTIRAGHVVGADGVHSRTAAQLGVQRPLRWLDRLALIGRFHGVPARAAAEVHFVDGGYFAATTVDDGTFHCNLVCDRARVRQWPDSLDAFVAARLEAAPLLAERLRHAERVGPWRGTGPLAFRTTRQTQPGLALVGDACGYVDPLTGEGIYFALHGARTLATALTAATQDPHRAAAALRGYARARQREVGPRLLLTKVLQRSLRWPALVDACMHLLATSPRLCDLLVTMTGDCVHPRDLLRPSFWRAFGAARGSA